MTERDDEASGDPVGDFQRWLMRSGARGLSRELTGQFRRAFSQGGGGHRGARGGDVWEEATTHSDPGEAPECAWCPVCRAARAFRQSGPGLGAHVAGAGDAVAAAVQQAFAMFESAMQGRTEPPGPAPSDSPSPGPAPAGPAPSGSGAPGPAAPGPSPSGRDASGPGVPGSAPSGPDASGAGAPGPAAADSGDTSDEARRDVPQDPPRD